MMSKRLLLVGVGHAYLEVIRKWSEDKLLGVVLVLSHFIELLFHPNHSLAET